MLPCQQEQNCNLQNQYSWNSQREFQVSGFVAEKIHACKASDTAAYGGSQHQRGFRNPPEFFLSHTLVCKHKQKPNRIDYKEVDKKHLCHDNTFLEGI